VIFDTDMGNDIDDALALAMLHSLTGRGECELIGVTLTNAHSAAVPYIRMINRFYGRADLPVGGAGDGYMATVLRGAATQDKSTAEPAPAVLRRLLTSAREKVVIVQTGFSTNLAALLDSPGGVALIREKVDLVVAPTAMVFSGFEIGRDLLYPAESMTGIFCIRTRIPSANRTARTPKCPTTGPVGILRRFLKRRGLTEGISTLSEPGAVLVEANGATRFTPGRGDRRYLRQEPPKRMEVLTSSRSAWPLRARVRRSLDWIFC
jgi:hypothetical protein